MLCHKKSFFLVLTFKNWPVEYRYKRKGETMTGNMKAKTLTGTCVTINDCEVIVQNGKPVIFFFVKDENGNFGLFNQNDLKDFSEV